MKKTLLLCLATTLTVYSLNAQTALTTTIPVGFSKNAFAQSPNGTTRVFTTVSFPLSKPAVFAGKVASVSSNTVTLTGASLGNLTTSPHLLHIRNAQAAVGGGRSFLITGSTASSVTLDTEGLTLSSLLAANDLISIIPANTIGSIFGATNATVKFKQGEIAGTSDNVYLFEGGNWATYYYFPSYGWVKDGDGSYEIRNSTVIFPDEGALVGRVSTNSLDDYAMSLGEVPSTARKASIAVTGLTFISNQFPKAIALSDFGFTTSPAWKTGETAGTADNVYLFENGGWKTYYYFTGYGWVLDGDGSYAIKNTHPIPIGAAMLVRRISTATPINSYVQTALPYSVTQ